MKQKRQEKILELIAEYEIETQEELLQRLREAGIEATQATVSRDIRELRLTKAPGKNGRVRYISYRETAAQSVPQYESILREGFRSIDYAQDILVIKTGSGMAMAVAAAIDGMELPEVVGCIAGDDTIFCAVRKSGDVKKVRERLERLTG